MRLGQMAKLISVLAGKGIISGVRKHKGDSYLSLVDAARGSGSKSTAQREDG